MMLKYNNSYPHKSRLGYYWKTIGFADVISCSPPKLFIPTICLLQVAVWLYHDIYDSELA